MPIAREHRIGMACERDCAHALALAEHQRQWYELVTHHTITAITTLSARAVRAPDW